MKALTMVLPDSRIETGVPTASGNCAWMARAKWRSVSLSFGSPFGVACTRTRPSAAIHCDARDVRQVLQRHRAGLQIIPQLRQRGPQRHCEGRFRGVALVLAGIGELGQVRGQTIGRLRTRTARLGGQFRERVGGALQRSDVLRIARRRAASSVLNGVCNCRASPRINASLRSWPSGTKSAIVVTLSTSGILRS